MADPKIKVRCKYYNSGFCRYGKICKFFHPTSVCLKDTCRDKDCPSRHPRQCRYRKNCKRKATCMYKHFNNVTKNTTTNAKYLKVEAENKKLTAEIEVLKANIETSQLKLSEVKNCLKEDKNVKDSLRVLNLKYLKLEAENVALFEEVKLLKASNFTVVDNLVESEKHPFSISATGQVRINCDQCDFTARNIIILSHIGEIMNQKLTQILIPMQNEIQS